LRRPRYCNERDRRLSADEERRLLAAARALQVLAALAAEAGTADSRLLPLTANALKIAFFRRVLPASGVAHFHFHDLRHEG
jgi:hypothetical protein